MRATTVPIRRRELLTSGLAVGAGALLLGGVVPARDAAAGRAVRAAGGATGTGSLGDGTEVTAAAVATAMPTPEVGARMIGIFGTAFYTMGYDPSDQASVIYTSGKGAHAGGDGTRLFARIPVDPGARLVRLDYFGFRDTSGQQMWWLSRRDPTQFAVVDVTSDTASGTGAIGATRTVNELVLPGYDYSVGCTSGLGATGEPYARGAVVQYLPAAGDFFPIAPKRVYDSRVHGGRISGGEERTISLALQLLTANLVLPLGATAVAVNLTVDQTEGAGWLSMRPAGTEWDGTSSINWAASGAILANGVTCRLGGNRDVTVRCGGGSSTDFIVDVVGYYL